MPSDSDTPLATTSVVVVAPLVARSIEKLPLRVCPETVSCAPVAVTARYGPAWSEIETVWAPTVSESLTAWLVWLIETPKVPLRPAMLAGRTELRLTVPCSWPATPPPLPGTITSRPVTLLRTLVRELERSTLPPLTPRTTVGLLPAWGRTRSVNEP